MSRDHLNEVKELIDKYENCYDKEIALKYAYDLMRYHARWSVEQAERVQELEEVIGKADEHAVRNGKQIMELTDEKAELEYQNKRLGKRVQELEDLAEHRLKMLKYCSDARKKYFRALKFYADEKKYEFETIVSDCDIEVESKILEDGGGEARQALEEHK